MVAARQVLAASPRHTPDLSGVDSTIPVHSQDVFRRLLDVQAHLAQAALDGVGLDELLAELSRELGRVVARATADSERASHGANGQHPAPSPGLVGQPKDAGSACGQRLDFVVEGDYDDLARALEQTARLLASIARTRPSSATRSPAHLPGGQLLSALIDGVRTPESLRADAAGLGVDPDRTGPLVLVSLPVAEQTSLRTLEAALLAEPRIRPALVTQHDGVVVVLLSSGWLPSDPSLSEPWRCRGPTESVRERRSRDR